MPDEQHKSHESNPLAKLRRELSYVLEVAHLNVHDPWTKEALENDLEGFNHGRLSPIELVESIGKHLNDCSDLPAVDWSNRPVKTLGGQWFFRFNYDFDKWLKEAYQTYLNFTCHNHDPRLNEDDLMRCFKYLIERLPDQLGPIIQRPTPPWQPELGKIYGFWDTETSCRPWIGEFSNKGEFSGKFGVVNREQAVIFLDHIIELESLDDALHTVADLKKMGRRSI